MTDDLVDFLDEDLFALLIGVVLLVVGIAVNWSRYRRRRELTRQWRFDSRVEELYGQGQHDAASALLAREVERARVDATSEAKRLRLADLLQRCATQHHIAGQWEIGLRYAQESATVLDTLIDPQPQLVAAASLTLGRLLAAAGDDEAAAVALRQACTQVEAIAAKSQGDGLLSVLAAVNLSLVLRRLTLVDEALDLASRAVEVDQGISRVGLPRYALAGTAWAHIALSLAQTDNGQDGRPAADDAHRAWKTLTDHGTFPDDSDGPAFAEFAMAHAVRPFDQPAAAMLAHQALARFARLQPAGDGRRDHRLAATEAALIAMTRPVAPAQVNEPSGTP